MEQYTKLIYKFQYETPTNMFHGYLDPSWDHSIISLKRLVEHGLEDESKLTFKPVTSLAYTINNKFENIVGIHELKILFENTSSGMKRSGGTAAVVENSVNGIGSELLVEKEMDDLVLRESNVEFRLGNDFLTHNATIERRSN